MKDNFYRYVIPNVNPKRIEKLWLINDAMENAMGRKNDEDDKILNSAQVANFSVPCSHCGAIVMRVMKRSNAECFECREKRREAFVQ